MSFKKIFSIKLELKEDISHKECSTFISDCLKNNDKILNFSIEYKLNKIEGNVVIFNNVALPVLFQDSFTPFDWEILFDFYPKYVKECEGLPLDFPQYCEAIAKELEIRKCRESRNYKDWLKIMINHVGYENFEKKCLEYKNI
jgi:hypothetical protein